MSKSILPLLMLSAIFCCNPVHEKTITDQKTATTAIHKVLDQQVEAWNKGDVDKFMESYWKSDSLLFIGSKVTSGWRSTLERYKKSYPGKAAMGILKFEILKMDYISDDSYLITGKYQLTRENDAPDGIFTLLFMRKKGDWVIVYDHTSSRCK